MALGRDIYDEVFEVDGILYDLEVYKATGNYVANIIQPMFQLKDDHFDYCEEAEDLGHNCGHGILMRFSELLEGERKQWLWFWTGGTPSIQLDEWEIL